MKKILYKEGKIKSLLSPGIPEITKGTSGPRLQAFLVGQVPITGKLEDILQVYLHHNCPRKIWNSFSSSQKEGFKDHLYKILIKQVKIELFPPSKVVRNDLRKVRNVMTSSSGPNKQQETSKKPTGAIKDLHAINDQGHCPINQTNGMLDTMVVKEVLKVPREHWESTKDMIKFCEQQRKKVHEWFDQKYK